MDGFFPEKLLKAFETGKYYCPECGKKMQFEEDNELYHFCLICLNCGYSTDVDHYGFENPEDYDDLFPTKEDLFDFEDDD